MANDVVVVISTYNGSKNIIRQLDSIFNQDDVDVSVFIRDDHSTDDTVNIVEEYRQKNGYKIDIVRGENEGYAKSFWDALRHAPLASYYAFSDQDDVWEKDKLYKCLQVIKNDVNIPQLAYCRMTRTDLFLNPLDEQVEVLRPEQLNRKLVLTQTYNYGAATVFNYAARKLICRHFPKSGKVPHDAWTGILCFWFGKIHFVNEPLYSWVRYESSVTGEGTKLSGIKFRIKETLAGRTYQNVSSDLIEYYGDLLDAADLEFLRMMCDYKKNLKSKFKLVFDRELRRSSIMGSIMLKYGIITNRF